MEFICLPIIFFTGLLLTSILTSLFSVRFGIPLILLFIIIGIIVGSQQTVLLFTGFLTPQNVFFIGSVALAIILFESGFSTPIDYFKKYAVPSLILATIGVIVSVLFLVPIILFILPVSFMEAILLASIIGSTDAAAVFFLLRSHGLKLKPKIQATLEIESGSNDPMAIFLTFLCITVLSGIIPAHSNTALNFLSYFLKQLFIGVGCGFLLFYILKKSIYKLSLEQALYPLFVLSVVMLGFALITLIGGSGYLALYLCGLLLGNSTIKAHSSLAKFQKTIAWLSQILMFTVLGIFVHYQQLLTVLPIALLCGSALIFIARPIMVFSVLAFFKKYTLLEKFFISFVGLRGATSVLLALIPIVYGFPFGLIFFNIIFIMVLLSLTLQGLLIPYVAKKCQVLLPYNGSEPQKTEIDLPDFLRSSLISYELGEHSSVLHGQSLPKWAQPLLLKRKNLVFQSNNIPTFQQGDIIYVFAPSENQIPLLDRLYANSCTQDKLKIWGDFPISPSTTIKELQFLYGIDSYISKPDLTLNDFIKNAFPEADIGDRISLGNIDLIIRSRNKKNITQLGIDVTPNTKIKTYFFKLPVSK